MVFAWLSNADEYATIHGKTKDDRSALRVNVNVLSPTDPINLEPIYDGRGVLPLGDFPNLGVATPACVSRRVVESVGSLLESRGIVREAIIDGADCPFYLFWPTIWVDCLDLENSIVEKTLSGYERLIRPVFHDEILDENAIFLIPQFPTKCIFVGCKFVEIAQEKMLRGAEFRDGWHKGANIIRT